nr:hypothetical protein [Haloarcula sp. CK38]
MLPSRRRVHAPVGDVVGDGLGLAEPPAGCAFDWPLAGRRQMVVQVTERFLVHTPARRPAGKKPPSNHSYRRRSQ